MICLYRLSDFVLNIMNPFYADLGFSKTEIAEVRKVFGVVMSVLGVGLGGFSVARLGLMRSLVIGAFAGPLSNLVFAWLATQGAQLSALFVAIGVDNVAAGFSGTCLIAYMSSLTSAGFTATQYALFSSLYALPGKLIASQSGRIVESSAAAADLGGPLAGLKALFARLPPEAYGAAAAKTGVSPRPSVRAISSSSSTPRRSARRPSCWPSWSRCRRPAGRRPPQPSSSSRPPGRPEACGACRRRRGRNSPR